MKIKMGENWRALNQKIEAFFNFLYDGFMKFFRKHYLWIVFLLIFAFSLVVRIAFLEYLSGDMYHFLLPWFNFLRGNGGLQAMGSYPWDASVISRPGDYPVAYITLLALFSHIPGEPIKIIKIISIFFDYSLAFAGVLIIRQFVKKKFTLLITFTVLVFFPTSILNSAVWGQVDQLYTSFILWSIYLLIRKKNKLAMIPLALGLAVKIQTVFFFPVLIFMWLDKKFKLRYFLILAFVTFLTFLPSYFVGAPFLMPFNMYVNQVTNMYSNANYNSGSLYAFFDVWHFKAGINDGAGVFFAFSALGVALLYFYHYKIPATPKNIIYASALFSILSPFVLPHMHERYFFFADAMLIIYVFVYQRKYLFALFMSISSVITYMPFLTGQHALIFLGADSIRVAALINLGLIICLIKEAPKVLEREEVELITNE